MTQHHRATEQAASTREMYLLSILQAGGHESGVGRDEALRPEGRCRPRALSSFLVSPCAVTAESAFDTTFGVHVCVHLALFIRLSVTLDQGHPNDFILT